MTMYQEVDYVPDKYEVCLYIALFHCYRQSLCPPSPHLKLNLPENKKFKYLPLQN